MAIPWTDLKNPVYSQSGWSVKDACVTFYNDEFYLFFSAFYKDREKERSHIVAVKTTDWQTYSSPILHLDGREDGWTGLCSPNITKHENLFYLTYNSWGKVHANGKTNDLFCITSSDLKSWSEPIPIAPELTSKITCIDLAITFANDSVYAIWKQEIGKTNPGTYRPVIAKAPSLKENFEFLEEKFPKLELKNKRSKNRIYENYQFIEINKKWHLLTTAYRPHDAVLFEMKGTGKSDQDWLYWFNGRAFDLPRQWFNFEQICNAPFLADWRSIDGFFYLLYAGRQQAITHAGRGNNKLALARSKDLVDWKVPPKQ